MQNFSAFESHSGFKHFVTPASIPSGCSNGMQRLFIPILGACKIHGDFAPWEIKNPQNLQFFNSVQLQLIDYFSQEKDSTTLQNTAAFVLAAWCQDCHLQYLNTQHEVSPTM